MRQYPITHSSPHPMIANATDTCDEIQHLHQLIANGKRAALATVVATWGSSPRQVGSHLVIDETGRFQGSVSGGCIEGAVVAEALAVIQDGKPRTLEFGVSDEQAWEVGLSCGGAIRIFVEPVA